MKILLLGANGQLGYELHRQLAVFGEVEVSTRDGILPGGLRCKAIDIGETEQLESAIREARPNLIVNASAFTGVDLAEQQPERAWKINVHAVASMAASARELSALLIHFSSDYVYSGYNAIPWTERDPCAPESQYGRSKLAGDLAIVDSRCAHWIIRTQWLYAARGNNFMRAILRRAQEGKPLRVVGDQFGAPTPVRWVASAVSSMVSRWLDQFGVPGQSSTGVYHFAAQGTCSWHTYALELLKQAHALGLLREIPDLREVSTAEYAAPAPRPRYGVLNCQKIKREFDIAPPNWREGLRQTLCELAIGETPSK